MLRMIKAISILALLMIVSFTLAVAQRAKDAETHFKRGEEYIRSNKYNEAIREFKQVIRIRPDWAEAYFKMGVAYSVTPLVDENSRTQYKAALEAFREAVRLKPDWAEAHDELGVRYITLSQCDDAIKSLKEAIKLKPDFATAHEHLGTAYLCKKQYGEAVESLKEAVRLKPDWALARKVLGLAYLASDEIGKALEQYNILKSLDQEMANYLRNRLQNADEAEFGEADGRALNIPKPEYPEAGKKDRLAASVRVEVEIDEEGKVILAHALNGPPELQKAAEAAAVKARFWPTELSGIPVKVKRTISYEFSPP